MTRLSVRWRMAVQSRCSVVLMMDGISAEVLALPALKCGELLTASFDLLGKRYHREVSPWRREVLQ